MLTCNYVTLFTIVSCEGVSTLHINIQKGYVIQMLTSDQVVKSFSCLHEQSRPGRHLNGLELIVFHILESALLLRLTIII